MKRVTLAAILVMAGFAPVFRAAETADLMAGKQKTDRTIVLEAVVDAPPAEVFRLWTSTEGVKKFCAALGWDDEARANYERALAYTELPAERNFLLRRLNRRAI